MSIPVGAGPHRSELARTSASSSRAQFPFALAYFTGSKAHNVAMRGRAKDRGWRLNEYSMSEVAVPVARRRSIPPSGWTTSRRSCARTPARSTAAENHSLPNLVERPRHPGGLSQPHDGQRRHGHARRDGRGRARPRLRVPRHRRPLAVAGHGARPDAASASGSSSRRDRRAQREVRRASGSSRAPSATSSPTARSISTTSCSTVSTTSWPASTRSSASRARR